MRAVIYARYSTDMQSFLSRLLVEPLHEHWIL
jgi:hypothetical protein